MKYWDTGQVLQGLCPFQKSVNQAQSIQLQAKMVTAQDRQKIMFIMVAAQPAQPYPVIGYLLAPIKEP